MSKVKRYGLGTDVNFSEGMMEECDMGHYVEYSDYEKLQAEIERLKDTLRFTAGRLEKMGKAHCEIDSVLHEGGGQAGGTEPSKTPETDL